MELLLERDVRSPLSTTGKLYANGTFECFVLEDTDRQLSSDMKPEQIAAIKVAAKTCIPTGRYEVVITFSNRFQRQLPLLRNVPGYSGIRIHPGNTAENTEGCLLPGVARSKDRVSSSRIAFNALFEKIRTALTRGKVFITIS